MLCVNRP